MTEEKEYFKEGGAIKWWNPAEDKKLKDIINLAEPINKTILDAGVGKGRLLANLKAAKSVVALDISRDMLNISRELLLKDVIEADTYSFIVGDIEHLPLKKYRFDVVICMDPLVHLPNKQLALNELSKVIKDDGLIAVDVTSANPIRQLVDNKGVKEKIKRFINHILVVGTRSLFGDNLYWNFFYHRLFRHFTVPWMPCTNREFTNILHKAGLMIQDMRWYGKHKVAPSVFLAVCCKQKKETVRGKQKAVAMSSTRPKCKKNMFFNLYQNSIQEPEDQTWEEERYKLIRHLCDEFGFTGSIVDIGGGGVGIVLSHMDLSQFKPIILIDLSMKRVKDAKKRIKSPNVHFIVADAQKVPLTIASSDNLLCLELIEHIPNWQNSIKEIKRISNKGAYLILSTPNKESKYKQREKITIPNIIIFFRIFVQMLERKLSIKEFLLIVKNVLRGRHHTHVREFSYNEIVKLISLNGFKLIKTYGYRPNEKRFLCIDANTNCTTYSTMLFLWIFEGAP